MRQLDLFGSFFETPSQEEKPEEKPVSKKEEENKNATDAAKTPYSKNTLRSERISTAVSPENLTLNKDEKSDVIQERLLEQTPTSKSLFSLFDAPVSNNIEPAFQKTEENITETQEQLLVVEDSEEVQVINLPEPEIIAVSEVLIEPEVVIIQQETPSMVTPVIKSLPNNGVVTSEPIVAKQKKQKLPELERTGSVVFDDGKISVKIKNKSPFPAPIIKEKKEKPKKVLQKRGRKSFKEIDAEVDLIEIPEDEILFQKQYYAISEVAKWFRVNTSLLRFWENEFDVLKPRKNRKGDRLFRPEDVKNLQLIYQLLRQRKYTIEGAKEYIKTNKKKADIQLQLTNTLQKFKSFLLDMKANLQ